MSASRLSEPSSWAGAVSRAVRGSCIACRGCGEMNAAGWIVLGSIGLFCVGVAGLVVYDIAKNR